MIQIYTEEPITILVRIAASMAVIYVDGKNYAVIDNVTDIEQLALDTIGRWVEETYYSMDYLNQFYTPCYLKHEVFIK